MSSGHDSGFTYRDVGATRGDLPLGYQHLERHRTVGVGRKAFEQAADRVMTWGVQRGAGLTVRPEAPRAASGVHVSVRLGLGPVGVSAPCRVVYTVEEDARVGFAYGTLPGHPESGEELFVVEHRADDSVRLTVRAFSRPARWYSPGWRLLPLDSSSAP
jgi:uncharacterized protein (UPF0548 family)